MLAHHVRMRFMLIAYRRMRRVWGHRRVSGVALQSSSSSLIHLPSGSWPGRAVGMPVEIASTTYAFRVSSGRSATVGAPGLLLVGHGWKADVHVDSCLCGASHL
jgi:hypothetical protein